MKKTIIYLLTCFAWVCQAQETYFLKEIGQKRRIEEFKKVIPAVGGGYLAVGQVDGGPDNDEDVLICRLTESGKVRWSRSYLSASLDAATDIVQKANGDIFVSGYTFETGVAGAGDHFAFKTDSNGMLLWSQKYGDNIDDESKGMVLASDGNLIIYGAWWNLDVRVKGYVAKINETDGTLLWARLVNYPKKQSTYFIGAAADTNGGIALSGLTLFPPFDFEPYFARLDGNGNVLQSKAMRVLGTQICYGVKKLEPSAGYLLYGVSTPTGQSPKGFLAGLNKDGSNDWYRHYGVTPYTRFTDVAVLSADSFLVTGYRNVDSASRSAGMVAKVGKTNASWARSYGSGTTRIQFSSIHYNPINKSFLTAGFAFLNLDSSGNGIVWKSPLNLSAGACNGITTPVTLTSGTATRTDSVLFETANSTSTTTFQMDQDTVILADSSLCFVTGLKKPLSFTNGRLASPNPASGKIAIKLPEGEYPVGVEAELFDMQGKLVLQQKLSGAAYHSLSVQHLPGGSYLLKINTKDKIYSEKILLNP